MVQENKKALLGMDAGTASNKLVKDILFKYIFEAGHKCFRCGGELTRDTFSIEHKTAWMSADNPHKAFFDLDNIAYSHKSCNYAAAHLGKSVYECGTAYSYNKGCRCELCSKAKSDKIRRSKERKQLEAERLLDERFPQR